MLETEKPFESLSVLALQADDSACGHYRVQYPMEFLRRGGANVKVSKVFSFNEALPYNIILAQRQYDRHKLDVMRALQQHGKMVIYELDDNLHAVHPNNPAYQHFYPNSPTLKGVEEWMKECDGFFTSTYELASHYQHYAKRTWVLPNRIDFGVRDWDTPVERPEVLRDKIVIGWAGGIHHQDDIGLLGDSLNRVLRRYPNTMIAVASAYRIMEMFRRDLKIPEDRLYTIDPVEFDQYPPILGHFDVGLAPIATSRFNMAKSNLRLLEYLAKGIPYVATPLAPYVRLHEETQGEFGELAQSRDWEGALSKLLDGGLETIRSKGQAGRRYVQDHYSYRVGAWEWAKAIAECAHFKATDPGAKRVYSGAPEHGKPGRNDLCPCGSGRKYKKCHPGVWG